jgi:hypothetical protein
VAISTCHNILFTTVTVGRWAPRRTAGGRTPPGGGQADTPGRRYSTNGRTCWRYGGGDAEGAPTRRQGRCTNNPGFTHFTRISFYGTGVSPASCEYDARVLGAAPALPQLAGGLSRISPGGSPFHPALKALFTPPDFGLPGFCSLPVQCHIIPIFTHFLLYPGFFLSRFTCTSNFTSPARFRFARVIARYPGITVYPRF